MWLCCSCSDQCVDVCRLLTDKDLFFFLVLLLLLVELLQSSRRLFVLLHHSDWICFFFCCSFFIIWSSTDKNMCGRHLHHVHCGSHDLRCTQHIFMCFSDRSEKWSWPDRIKNMFIHINCQLMRVHCPHPTIRNIYCRNYLFLSSQTAGVCGSFCQWKEINILKVSHNYEKKNQSSEFLSHDYDLHLLYLFSLTGRNRLP